MTGTDDVATIDRVRRGIRFFHAIIRTRIPAAAETAATAKK